MPWDQEIHSGNQRHVRGYVASLASGVAPRPDDPSARPADALIAAIKKILSTVMALPHGNAVIRRAAAREALAGFDVRGALASVLAARRRPDIAAVIKMWQTVVNDRARRVATRAAARTRRAADALRAGLLARAAQERLGVALDGRTPVEVLDSFAALTDKERHIVEAAANRWRRQAEAAVANPCAHMEVKRRLYNEKSFAGRMRVLAELRRFYKTNMSATARSSQTPSDKQAPTHAKSRPSGDASENLSRPGQFPNVSGSQAQVLWFSCRVCGHDIICPHEDAFLEMSNAEPPRPYAAVRTRLEQFAMKFSKGGSFTYFCRVCGGAMADLVIQPTGVPGLGSTGDEPDRPIRRLAWSFALDAATVMRFPTPTDPRRFAAEVSDVCESLIGAAALAARRPPSSEDYVDPRTKLDAILYVYAFAALVIKAHMNDAPDKRVAFKEVVGSRLSEYMGAILNHIVSRYGRVISMIENITPAHIRDRLLEAYADVARGGVPRIVPEDENRTLVENIGLNPTFTFARLVAQIVGVLPWGAPTNDKQFNRIFEVVMGGCVEFVADKAHRNIKEIMALGFPDPFAGRVRDALVIPPGANITELYSDPAINLFSDLFSISPDVLGEFSTRGAGEKRAAPRVAKKRAAPRRAVNTSPSPPKHGPKSRRTADAADVGLLLEAYTLLRDYQGERMNDEAVRAYDVRLAKIRNHERSARDVNILARASGSSSMHLPPNPFFVMTPVAITEIYDENGFPHRWGVNIYRDGGGKLHEGGVAEIGRDLVDRKCTTCGVCESQTSRLDDARTLRAVDTRSKFGAFFAFFESRCPEGASHEWRSKGDIAESNICSKCGVDSAMSQGVTARLGGPAHVYYKRYSGALSSALQQVRRTAPARTVGSRTDATAESKLRSEAGKWRGGFGVIAAAAAMIGETPARLENLGAFENRAVEELSAEITGPPPDSIEDSGAVASDAVARRFLSNLSALRNVDNFGTPPAWVANILKTTNATSRTARMLPDPADFWTARGAIRRFRPADAAAYAVWSICSAAVALDSVKGAAKQLGAAFARWGLKNIIDVEMRLTAHEAFDITIITRENSVSLGSDATADISIDDVADAGDGAGDGAGDADDSPISYDSIDYDGRND